MKETIRMKIKYFIGLGVIILSVVFYMIRSHEEKPKFIDFNQKLSTSEGIDSHRRTLNVAVSAMTSPKHTLIYYQNLVEYLSEKLHLKPHFVQRKTYREINELLARRQLDLAFICSGAYISAIERGVALRLLAIPVIEDETSYHAVIIVRKESPYKTFDDLRGHRFAFTDPLSNTGYRYPLSLLALRNTTPDDFFKSHFFTYAHDNSIQAVRRGITDGASVDEFIFCYLKRKNPALVQNIRIIRRSNAFGMPPVVSPAGLHPAMDQKIRQILFGMNKDPKGRQILEKLGIQRFTSPDSTSYESVKKIYRLTEKLLKP
ncbi:MAG TPA: phosphate/phosphite/phosphonate ABC transporter substrate-binding protein [Bacteroidetes bacterium]|nr:phosphate/phosphite/phosphonate ABC transporter substrate-binding protein [Bacteroidota bacterium]HDZ12454.1 phosphate/phosphite/phosphonate ABC transporter substrate-binding protein [Bacteroidota bacterium]